MNEVKEKLDNLLSKIVKIKMTSKEYDEMESIDSIMNLGIPGLEVSLARELIDARYELQKRLLSNKKVTEAANRSFIHSNVVDFKNDLNKSQSHLDETRNYYESLLKEAIKTLNTKER